MSSKLIITVDFVPLDMLARPDKAIDEYEQIVESTVSITEHYIRKAIAAEREKNLIPNKANVIVESLAP